MPFKDIKAVWTAYFSKEPNNRLLASKSSVEQTKLLFFSLNTWFIAFILRHMQLYIYILMCQTSSCLSAHTDYYGLMVYMKNKNLVFHVTSYLDHKLHSGSLVTRHPWTWCATEHCIREKTLPRLNVWKAPKCSPTCEAQVLVSTHLGYY